MKPKSVMLIMISVGLLFGSCKDGESKKISTETKIITEETVNPEPETEFAKLLDKVENYVLTEYLTEGDLRAIPKDQRKFQLHQIDLNNDGKKEVFVNFTSTYFCGTGGCNVLLLNDQLKLITEFTVTRTPIYVEDTLDNGWKVLMVQSEGKWRKLSFENGSYPSNPSVAEVSNDSPTESAAILFDSSNNKLKTYSF